MAYGHQYHVLGVEAIAKNNPNALLVTNFEVVSWFANKGIDGHGMNHGGKFKFDFGTAKYVNVIHSSMLPDGSNGGNPGGFVLWDDSKCIYIAGDTALEVIPKTCPKLDIAILPIGDNFTMGYEDAAIASDFIQCNQIIGCHYDTFPPIKIDKSKAVAYFVKKGKKLMLPDIVLGKPQCFPANPCKLFHIGVPWLNILIANGPIHSMSIFGIAYNLNTPRRTPHRNLFSVQVPLKSRGRGWSHLKICLIIEVSPKVSTFIHISNVWELQDIK